MEALKDKKTNVTLSNPKVPFESIEAGLNVRKDFGDMEELVKSINTSGLWQPLIVRSGKNGNWIITDGHRRFKALQQLVADGYEFEGIPVVIENDMKEEDLLLGLLIHNDGKPLTMTEQAEVFNRLEKAGWGTTRIANSIGKTGQHVRDCKLLAAATAKVLQLIAEGKISATSVLKFMRIEGDPKKAEALILASLEEIVAKGKTKVSNKDAKEKTAKASTPKDSAGVGSVKDRINACYDLLVLSDKTLKYSECDLIHIFDYIQTGEGTLGKLLEGAAKGATKK